MTSRERVLAAINHKQPDRMPIDLGSNGQTGMNASTLYKLREALGLEQKPIKIVEPFQMLGEIEEDLLSLVSGDVLPLWNRGTMIGYNNENWKPWNMDDGTPVFMAGGFEYDEDERGNKWVYPQGDRNAPYSALMPKGGSFFDAIDHTERFDWDMDEEDYTPREDFKDDFAVATDEDARHWENESKRLYEGTNHAIMGIVGGGGLGDVAMIPGPSLKHPKGVRRVDDWLAMHAMCPDYIEEVFGYQTEIMLKNLEIYKQAVGDRIQVVWISGTDFGTQNNTFTSQAQFRKLYKPFYKQINDYVHTNTAWKTFYHTCGAIAPLLDDLAEMGVDCLNPLQLSAKGMNGREIKAKYGDKFTFWGGGVDTQKTLPFGTPDEVREQVTERISYLNEGGGYIFNPIHNVVSNVPAENLIAMYEAALGKKLR